jgi:hypothetical protein
MNKLLLSIVALLYSCTISFAQCTVVNPSPASLSPDSATNLTHACVGKPYTQVIQIHAIKDTLISVTTPLTGDITADIDSIVIDKSITNLPSYITLTSTPATLPPAGAGAPKSNYERLVVKGDSSACVKMDATNVTGTTGTTNLTIKTRVYLSNMHSTNLILEAAIPLNYPGRKVDTTVNITYYKYVIDAPGTGVCLQAVAVSNLEKYGFELKDAQPNPADNYTQIVFNSNKALNLDVQITDLTGKVIYAKNVKSILGLNYITIDTKTMSSGMYMYSIANGNERISKKLMIK